METRGIEQKAQWQTHVHLGDLMYDKSDITRKGQMI